MNQKTSKAGGFTLIEIMIVVAIIGVLASIAIPNFLHARLTTQMRACITNLQQIDGAIHLWAMEKGAGENAAVKASDITPYINHGSLNGLHCPADPAKTFDTSYVLVDTSTKPLCKKRFSNALHQLTCQFISRDRSSAELPRPFSL